MIRFIVIILSAILFFILTLPFLLVEGLIGKKWPEVRDRHLLRVVQAYCHILLWLAGTKVTIIGKERIPKDQPVLYVMNHRSLLDIVITLAEMPSPTGYIGKKELAKVPILNLWLTYLHGYFIDHQNLRNALKTILAAIDEIKAGTSMAIFPEGTRNRGEDERQLLEFHEGSLKIAFRAGCPIVPVCLNGTAEIFEAHIPKVKPCHVIMEYLPPVDPKELTGEQKKFPGVYVRSLMEETISHNFLRL